MMLMKTVVARNGNRHTTSTNTKLLNNLFVSGGRKQQQQQYQQRQQRTIQWYDRSLSSFQSSYYDSIISQKRHHNNEQHQCMIQSRYFSSSGGSGGGDDTNNKNNNNNLDDTITSTPPPQRQFRIMRPPTSQRNNNMNNNSTQFESSVASTTGINYNRVGVTNNNTLQDSNDIIRRDEQGNEIIVPKDYYPRSRPTDDGLYKEPDETQGITPLPQYRLRPNTATIYPSAPMFPGDFTDYDNINDTSIFNYNPADDKYTKDLIQATAQSREQRMDQYEIQRYKGNEQHDKAVATIDSEMNSMMDTDYSDNEDDTKYYDADDDDDNDDIETQMKYDEYTQMERQDIYTEDNMMKRIKFKEDMIQAQRQKWIENSLTPKRESIIDNRGRSYGHGGRKTSGARVWIQSGFGNIIINKKPIEEYFERQTHRGHIIEPFIATETIGLFDVQVIVTGGGKSGQAGAIRHGIAKALLQYNPQVYHPILKYFKLLTRDNRQVERKKIGKVKARKSPQWVRR